MMRPYRNREEAGQVLAREVARVVRGRCVVAAIPRGGVVVAAPVAERLAAPLTLAYARKLTLPVAPELAVGAMDEDGVVILDPPTAASLGATPGEIDAARDRVRREIDRQRARYDAMPLADLAVEAVVVLVDDGLATGLTMRAALGFARRHRARRVIVAVPCASSDAAERFEREADRFVCPRVDPTFGAVGSYYLAFASLTDDEVHAVLEHAPRHVASAPDAAPPRS
jgi:putative phosphoribosyl transferase